MVLIWSLRIVHLQGVLFSLLRKLDSVLSLVQPHTFSGSSWPTASMRNSAPSKAISCACMHRTVSPFVTAVSQKMSCAVACCT